jgi:hypothetical protein
MAIANTRINPLFLKDCLENNAGILIAGSKVYAALCMSNATVDAQNPTTEAGATLDECDGAGYARVTLANPVITIHETNRKVKCKWDSFTFSGVGASTRAIDGICLIYDKDGTSSAATNLILGTINVTNITADGSDIEITMADEMFSWTAAITNNSAWNLEFLKAALSGTVDINNGTSAMFADLVMTNNVTDAQNPSPATEAAVTTPDVHDGANYVRKTIVPTITFDATDDVELDFPDITWTALGAGTRSAAGVLVYYSADGTDTAATNVPVITDRAASTRASSGNDFKYTFNAEGVGKGTVVAS